MKLLFAIEHDHQRREWIEEMCCIMAAEDRARTAMTAQRAASFTSYWELSYMASSEHMQVHKCGELW